MRLAQPSSGLTTTSSIITTPATPCPPSAWTSGLPGVSQASVSGGVCIAHKFCIAPAGYSSPRGVTLNQASSRFLMSKASNHDLNAAHGHESHSLGRDCIVKRFSSQPGMPVVMQQLSELDIIIQTKDGNAHRGDVAQPKDRKGCRVDVPQFMEAVVNNLNKSKGSDGTRHLGVPKANLVESLETSPGSTRSGTPRTSPENSSPASPRGNDSRAATPPPTLAFTQERESPSLSHSASDASLTPNDRGTHPLKRPGLGTFLPVRSRLAWMVTNTDQTPPPPRHGAQERNFDSFIPIQDEELLREVQNAADLALLEESTESVESPIVTPRSAFHNVGNPKPHRASIGAMISQHEPSSWIHKRRASFGGIAPASSCSTKSLHASPKLIQRSVPDLHKLQTKRKSRPVRERSPKHLERSPEASKGLVQTLLDATSDSLAAVTEDLLFESLPKENVTDLHVSTLHNEESRQAFLSVLRAEGNRMSRVRLAWHLAGSASAAQAIETNGIRCDEDHCHCGRYGRGGYVATSAAKANAYADSESAGGERCLFLVLALPEKKVIRGESGTRPSGTAADLPGHPTEYCFVDEARLHCVCRVDYSWAPTGRRPKIATAGGHCRAWRSGSGSPRDTRGTLKLRTQNS